MSIARGRRGNNNDCSRYGQGYGGHNQQRHDYYHGDRYYNRRSDTLDGESHTKLRS